MEEAVIAPRGQPTLLARVGKPSTGANSATAWLKPAVCAGIPTG